MQKEIEAARSEAPPYRSPSAIRYPRRRVLRWFLRKLAGFVFRIVGELRIEGRENLPETGPVILVANHFHFADPVALLYVSRRQVEFVGGFRFPNAPTVVKFLPKIWGYLPAFRGGYSRSTLDGAAEVLRQGGVLGIFPEGGAWAQVLRPPRPGAAHLALETGAVMVPVGIEGFTDLFSVWRPRLTLRVGRPIGPFSASGSGRERRTEVDQIGHRIMRAIAELLPPGQHGVYSDDPAIREAAADAARWPFSDKAMRGI